VPAHTNLHAVAGNARVGVVNVVALHARERPTQPPGHPQVRCAQQGGTSVVVCCAGPKVDALERVLWRGMRGVCAPGVGEDTAGSVVPQQKH
jgi:hypothetical protein